MDENKVVGGITVSVDIDGKEYGLGFRITEEMQREQIQTFLKDLWLATRYTIDHHYSEMLDES